MVSARIATVRTSTTSISKFSEGRTLPKGTGVYYSGIFLAAGFDLVRGTVRWSAIQAQVENEVAKATL